MNSVRPVVLMVGPHLPSLEAALRAAYDVVQLPEADDQRAAVLAARGSEVRAATVAFGRPFRADLMAELPTLGAVAHFGVGYDNIDVVEASRLGVLVSNTPDVLSDSVAEVAVGLALDVLHRFPAADRYVRAGRWGSDGPFPLGRQLAGKAVGILGLGRIGQEIAARFEAFKCPVRYHSRRPVEGAAYEYAETPLALAALSDILVAVVPGGTSTDGIVSREVLEALGPEGVFVNVARGSVADQDALVELLLDGGLGGAGLDVYAREPEVPEALMALDRVVLLPHVGSATVETREAMGRLVFDNVRTFLDQGSMVTPVNAP
jgi:lactate dehydrogenase-like 2-hydroxyacid dehydrogenase